MLSRCILVACALTVATHSAGAQAAMSEPSTRAPWNLFSVRYDTRTSDFIYAAYGYGNTFAMVATLQNPRSGYTELLGALGRKLSIANGPTQFVAIGTAKATDAWYAQIYFLPTLNSGRFWLRATTETYVPLEVAGTPQFALSPVAVTAALGRGIEAGLSGDVAVARDALPSTAIGPEIRLPLPHAVLGVDAQRVMKEGSSRFRVFFLTSF
jgi:hypothetical protein